MDTSTTAVKCLLSGHGVDLFVMQLQQMQDKERAGGVIWLGGSWESGEQGARGRRGSQKNISINSSM